MLIQNVLDPQRTMKFLNQAETQDTAIKAAVKIFTKVLQDQSNLKPTFSRTELTILLQNFCLMIRTSDDLLPLARVTLDLLGSSKLPRPQSA